MSDYRYYLPRKLEFKNGLQKHWYEVDEKLLNHVVHRIRAEGPLMAKDFEHSTKTLSVWERKPTKRALEVLYIRCELMISRRHNFHKVYDLTERVLPDDVDRSMFTDEEHARFLITSYLRSNGLGQLSEIIYLRKHVKVHVSEAIQKMLFNGELIKIKIGDTIYFGLPTILNLLEKRLMRIRLKILSPFDNLIIQRKRMKAFFDFDYLLECYFPKDKRRYGYFLLPLLWNGGLVGRFYCKADRAKNTLHIFHLSIEFKNNKLEDFAQALRIELSNFMVFNNCRSLELNFGLDPHIKKILCV